MDTKLIVSNPSIMMGKPVIAGTRIPVELILEKLQQVRRLCNYLRNIHA